MKANKEDYKGGMQYMANKHELSMANISFTNMLTHEVNGDKY